MKHGAQAYIGTSGYQYKHWRGPFYPADLPTREWFGFYSRHFDTVEINNTFYHLPDAAAFDRWRAQAPDNFCFALKFSRYGYPFLTARAREIAAHLNQNIDVFAYFNNDARGDAVRNALKLRAYLQSGRRFKGRPNRQVGRSNRTAGSHIHG